MKTASWVLEAGLPTPYIRINQLHRGPFTMKSHSHPFWQLILVTDGQLCIKTGSDTSTLCAGTMHILPPGWEHTLTSPDGYSQLGIDLNETCDERGLIPLLQQNFPQPSNVCIKQLLSLAEKISEEQHRGTALSSARLINLSDSLILCCLETPQSPDTSFEAQLSAYLDEHLSLGLCLSEIADHFYISIPHLERLCRRSYNCGVMALLKQRRFRKAQQLLISTELSIQEIGSAVGYPDAAHFSGFFKGCAGVSPRSFRRQSRLYA